MVPSDGSFFQLSGITNTVNILIWRTKIPKEIQIWGTEGKVTGWWTLQANGVVSRDYHNRKTVRGVDNFQIPNTDVQYEAHGSGRMLFFRRTELLRTLNFPSAFVWMECFRFHELKDMVHHAGQQDHRTRHTRLSSWASWRIKCIGLLYLLYCLLNVE